MLKVLTTGVLTLSCLLAGHTSFSQNLHVKELLELYQKPTQLEQIITFLIEKGFHYGENNDSLLSFSTQGVLADSTYERFEFYPNSQILNYYSCRELVYDQWFDDLEAEGFKFMGGKHEQNLYIRYFYKEGVWAMMYYNMSVKQMRFALRIVSDE